MADHHRNHNQSHKQIPMPRSRSPYPTRSARRRQQQEQEQEHVGQGDHQHEPSTTSMSDAAAAPAAAVNLSAATPSPHAIYVGRSKTSTTGNAPTPMPSSSPHEATPMAGQDDTREEVMDGMDLSRLRRLTESCLGLNGLNSGAPSPSTALFYSSILYAKTGTERDNMLYARALQMAEQPRRLLAWLQRDPTGLLYTATISTRTTPRSLDALLMACQAHTQLGEFAAMAKLLEGQPWHLHDDQDVHGWVRLAESMRQDLGLETDTVAAAAAAAAPGTSLHPLARLLAFRAHAYQQLGHPLRAATCYKLALRVDPYCVEALDGWLENGGGGGGSNNITSGITAIVGALQGDNGDDWLKTLYLAKVHAATAGAGTSSSAGPTLHDTHKPFSPHPQGEVTGGAFWQDAATSASSSMQLLTPIPQQASSVVQEGQEHHLDHQVHENSSPNPATAAAAAGESALDTLWNKYKLQRSPQVLAMAAQQAYRRHDLRAALQYCQALAALDPLSQASHKAALVHVSTLVALGQKRALFQLAHQWVEAAPKSSRAWFAVGSYYFACRRFHVSQRHFCRATRLDPHCAEAWIAFGAAFSACDESDQALASFRAAQRLAPGHHVSLLYMGMEYLRTNHLVLAKHFLLSALQASGRTDALCLNELGVSESHQRNYYQAITWFLQALATANGVTFENCFDSSPVFTSSDVSQLLERVQDDYWEPTLFNLAYAYRKAHQFDLAVQVLRRSLALKESASAYAALGYCLHLKSIDMGTHSLIDGNRRNNRSFDRNQVLHMAIDAYHQSLAKKADDPFCSEMLQKALRDALEQTNFFLQDDDDDGHVVRTPGMGRPATSSAAGGHNGTTPLNGTTPMDMAFRPSLFGSLSVRPPRFSMGSMGSQWTVDGLSLSVESASSDVDMA